MTGQSRHKSKIIPMIFQETHMETYYHRNVQIQYVAIKFDQNHLLKMLFFFYPTCIVGLFVKSRWLWSVSFSVCLNPIPLINRSIFLFCFLLNKFIYPFYISAASSPSFLPASLSTYPFCSHTSQSFISLFLFRKGQVSHAHQQNMAYQVVIRYNTSRCFGARKGNPI